MAKHLNLFFWLHLAVIILTWVSPALISWKLVLLGIVFYYTQLLIFGNCVLTAAQFGKKDRTISFYGYCLVKLGFDINQRKVILLADYVFPWVILGIALLLQLGINFEPLIF